ncbi:hypothetical protein [Streptomyces sp. NBC_00239]|uniref:hypothetical protein n=1 Tax=Streptomyces sp. NBC_00239 TaxID=2903640 RepID=UPI002E2C8105|nr:hypothetical protein [Streptomyces sp. NBC_00239]
MDAYTLWRSLPFPRSGPLEESITIRSDLALADEYVTTVIRFVERGIFKPAVPDVLAFLEEVLERIERLSDNGGPETQEIARSQHAYAALMHVVYSKFLEAGAEQEG